MKYDVSDIHGCYDKYMNLLERLDLGEDDTLYSLGDVIDRGADGFKIMLDMAGRSNVVALMGNHERMATKALPGIIHSLADEDSELTKTESEAIDLWFDNGGEASLENLLILKPEEGARVMDYMYSMPTYMEVEADGKQFVLVHGGFEGFTKSRPLDDYAVSEIVWNRPDPDTEYYPDKCVIVGHTPVFYMYQRAEEYMSQPKFFHGKGFIDIDCGCAFPGGRLGCLCLDTMEEIYV